MSSSIFPTLPGITWNITRAPKFATKVQQSVGGQTIAAAFQPYPIWRWQLEFEFLRTYGAFTEWQTLAGFFNSLLGAWDTFLYHDPEDYTVTAQLIGTGTGSLTTFQLGRTLGGYLFEPIYNTDTTNQTVKIYKNGVLQTVTTNYTISASGLVTFTSAPANGLAITWTGDFYWRCRMESDSTEFGMFAQHFWQAKQLSFLSVLGA